MKATTKNKAIGVILILGSLAATVVLTLKGMQTPAIVSTILTAAAGLVFPSLFHSCSKPAAIPVTVETPPEPPKS